MADDSERARTGRPRHAPTAESRAVVSAHVAVGTRHEVLAEILGICVNTLRLHYSLELSTALAIKNSGVCGVLYKKALEGDTQACIFWLKTRAGFRERSEVDHTSSDGTMSPTINVSALSSETIREIIAASIKPE